MKKGYASFKHSLRGLIYLLTLLFFISFSFLNAQERFRRFPPSPQPLVDLNLPEIRSHELINSLRFSVVQNTQSPDIHLQLIIFAGESHSPDDLPGLATFTAHMLSKGTSSFSSSEFENILASIGGRFAISVFPEHTIISMSFLEEFLDKGLDVLGKLVKIPSFTQREIAKLKTSLSHSMAGKRFDPDFVSRRLMLRILFQDHPHQKITFSEDGIKNIKHDNVRKYFQTFYRPNNSHLILTGGIDLQTASKVVGRHFNTWRKNNLKYSPPSPPKPVKRLKICLVDMPQIDDTTIFIGNVIALNAPEEYFSYSVFNRVLGSTPNSRLFMNLRETKGYAYYAFSQLDLFNKFGIFFIRAKVRSDVVLLSIEEILREIDHVMKVKIPSQEIEQAKFYLLGNFPIKMAEPSFFSKKVSEIIAFNLGEAHWTNYYENIMQIDSNKVFELIKDSSILTPTIVIVTNANLSAEENPFIDELIEKFGEVEVYNYKGILQYTLK